MKIGILGAGQLGMMLGRAGERLGMTFRYLDPATEISARDRGEHLCAAYEDVEALEEFVRDLDVITYEFENVPVMSARWLAERVPVHPVPEALRVAQDRLFEKSFFTELGIPSPDFADFFFRDEYEEALRHIGMPAVLKTRRFGYDGKGQRLVRDEEEADRAFEELHGLPLFLEGFVPFEREVSIIACRAKDGACVFYPLVENHHREGILRLSIAPAAGVTPDLQALAEKHARAVLEKLDYVGVLAIEFFEKDGMLYVNEMAPRVHNSGHWSIEGAVTSQFEQHVRAVLGWPLGSTRLRAPTVSANVLGTVDAPRPARLGNVDAVLAAPGAALHWYGKHEARPLRKMGHVTLVGDAGEGDGVDDTETLLSRARETRDSLTFH